MSGAPVSGTNHPTEFSEPTNRVLRILEAYLADLQRGAPPHPDELIDQHPDLAELLREYLASLQFLHGAALNLQDTPDASEGGQRRAQTDGIGRLGDYRLMREIGRGGMGIVYEAEQASLERRVALKVLPFAAVLDPKQLQRFKNEAQTAAQLGHPNIVPVFAVGCEQGVHYYAMQYIDGKTVAELIAECGRLAEPTASDNSTSAVEPDGAIPTQGDTPPIAAISTQGSPSSPAYFRHVAQLGVQAAEALHHAHEVGVVHRDIKPSNLIVDVQGKLWVTDFGLARLPTDAGLTMTGDVLGTLRYMSPEQASGNPVRVNHQTDVYSLGLTLYELLTLKSPFAATDRQRLLRQVAEDDPPSARTLNRLVPRDLETIILRAMAKESESRYASARQMAEDLKRFLEDRPVLARRPGIWERAAKWTRRHKVLVRAALLLLCCLTVGSLTGALLISQEKSKADRAAARAIANYQNAQTERSRAEENLRTAIKAVDTMLTRVADIDLRHVPQMGPVRKALLDDALTFYQRFLAKDASNPQLRLETARSHRRCGDILAVQRKNDEAHSHYRMAMHILENLAAESDHPWVAENELATSRFRYAKSLGKDGQPVRAEALIRQAIDDWEELCRKQDHPDFIASRFMAIADLAYLLAEQQRYAEAEQHFLEAIQGLLAVESNSLSNDVRYGLAWTHQEFANVLMKERPNEAEPHLRQALHYYQQLAQAFPQRAHYREGIASALLNLGSYELHHGNPDDAEDCIRETLRVRTQLTAEYPSTAAYTLQLAISYGMLADLLRRTDRSDEAIEAIDRRIDTLTLLRSPASGQIDFHRQVAEAHDSKARLFWALAQPETAAEEFTEVISTIEQIIALSPQSPRNHLWLSSTLKSLGEMQAWSGNVTGAKASYDRAIAVLARLADENPNELSYLRNQSILQMWVGSLLAKRQLNQSEQAYRQAETLLTQVIALNSNARDRWELALCYKRWGEQLLWNGDGQRYEDAVELFEKAVDVLTQLTDQFPRDPTYRRELMLNYQRVGEVLIRLERLPEANEHLRLAIEGLQRLHHETPDNEQHRRYLAELRKRLAIVLRKTGKAEEAKQQFLSSIELLEPWAETNALDMLELANSHRHLANFYRENAADFSAAESHYSQALAMLKELAHDQREADYKVDLALNYDYLSTLWVSQNRNLDQAVQYAQEAVRLMPDQADYAANLSAARQAAQRAAATTTRPEEPEQ